MQLRSGRHLAAPPLYTDCNNLELVITEPTFDAKASVRSLFALLNKYNLLCKENDMKYKELCLSVPKNDYREWETIVKNLEHNCIMEKVRLRTEMVSMLNDYFDIISQVVPHMMLYGLVVDARDVYNKYNEYRNTYLKNWVNYEINQSVYDVKRIIDILLDDIDVFDNKFTEFMIRSTTEENKYLY